MFLSQNGDPPLASVHVYPHACLESFHESSRHAHYCGQPQLSRHHSRVREEANGKQTENMNELIVSDLVRYH